MTDAPKAPTSALIEQMLSVACSGCARHLRAPRKFAGRSIRCPKCGGTVWSPAGRCRAPFRPRPQRGSPDRQRTVIADTSTYGFAVNASLYPNSNDHLGAEYFSIAKSLYAGEGFSSPFVEKTGPTAWMPPVLPAFLASLLWLADGDRGVVRFIVTWTQVHVILATGLLVLLLIPKFAERVRIATVVGGRTSALAPVGSVSPELLYYYARLLARDADGGHFGGVVVAKGVCSRDENERLRGDSSVDSRAWSDRSLALSGLGSACRSKWLGDDAGERVRLGRDCRGAGRHAVDGPHWFVLGRLIPIKANLSGEPYQSQCIEKEGTLHVKTFRSHPYAAMSAARREYRELGEIEFIDRKGELFWSAVTADPLDFLDRTAGRFVAAMIWYEPFEPGYDRLRPAIFWSNRITHPLALLAILVLASSAVVRPLPAVLWVAIGVYLLYMMPYVGISYYERYAIPMLGVRAVLIVGMIDRLLSFALGPRRTPSA